MIKDGKLIFITLASMLITISTIASYFFIDTSYSIIKTLIIAFPYAFAWVVLAWIITDKSFFRQAKPYLIIFLIILIEKISWINFQNNVLMILIEFFSVLLIFNIFWYLSRPRDYAKFSNKLEFLFSNRMVLIFLGAIIVALPLILWHIEIYSYDYKALIFQFYNLKIFEWDVFFILTIPVLVSFVILSFTVTNIKNKIKFSLYGVIILFLFFPNIPVFNQFFLKDYSGNFVLIVYFLLYFICYFIIYFIFILLANSKYLEQ
jgi:hypothetical protein